MLSRLHSSNGRHMVGPWNTQNTRNYTKHTISQGTHHLGGTWLATLGCRSSPCETSAVPSHPLPFLHDDTNTNTNTLMKYVKWNHKKMFHHVSCCLHFPWIFFSNQIDLDNSRWNSSRYRKVSFLIECRIKESSEEIRNRAEPLVLSCSDQVGWPCLLSLIQTRSDPKMHFKEFSTKTEQVRKERIFWVPVLIDTLGSAGWFGNE